ncbi:hypothetical protein [Streptomyces sp. SID13726]|uniref:VMAP-C domain-containing protein n=1 Tax=Streptomyces sp. SID13726 TaxID=2706058 RepID=UPI0013B75C62|nr:hypothetical protein [Streptomyces sp. SID13726]NEB03214.1 hypothetical protein [Streptomyces sp. SID13726]
MAAILVDIPRLQALQNRLDLVYDVGPKMRDVVQHSRPLEHLTEIVRTSRRVRVLPELRDVLLKAERYDIGAHWFALAVTVLTVPGPLPVGYMLSLIDELRQLPPEFGMHTVDRYVIEQRRADQPLDADGLPAALLALYDSQAAPAEPATRHARMVSFLDLLAQEAQAHEQGERLTGLLARVPGRRGEPAGLPAQERLPEGQESRAIIQIRVQEAGPPVEPHLPFTRRTYFLRGFRYDDTGAGEPRFRRAMDPTEVFPGAELDRRGTEFLLAWQQHVEPGEGGVTRYEFLLPDELLGHPVELWPSSSGVPLSYGCQVVVRSLTRYDDNLVHQQWARRWDALDRDCAPGDALKRIGWMSPEATNSPDMNRSCPPGRYPPLLLADGADVEDWLRDHKDLACLGLVAPYEPHDPLIRDAVRDALMYDGIPVIVWRRDAGDPGLLLDALRDSCPPALLAQLPESVHGARQRRRRDPLNVGRHITLLWDDPTCVFVNQNSQLPGTRGAGTGGGAA